MRQELPEVIMSGYHLPSQIGPYRAIEPRELGGMGRVYRAWKGSPRTGRAWALKVAIDDDPAIAARLQKEAELGPKLRHRNLIGVHEVIHYNGRIVLVSPWVEGETLHRFINRVSVVARTPLIVTQVAVETLCGLAHAHAQHVIHRDVSPENIMVGFDGAVRLFDFGIAGEWKDQPLRTRMGKPGYISPEQREGRADHRSDLYSLGVVLCQLCGARIDDPVPPAVPGGLPDDLGRLLERMVRAEPSERPQTATDALTEARRILARLGGAKQGVRALHEAMTAFAPGHATGNSLMADVNAAYRGAVWVLVGCAGMLLGLSAAAALVHEGSGSDKPQPPGGRQGSETNPTPPEPPPPRKRSCKLEECEASCKAKPASFDCTQWADLLRWRANAQTESQSPKASGLSAQISAREIRRQIIDIYARACSGPKDVGRGDPLACTRLALLAGMTAEPDLRAELAVTEQRPAAKLGAACHQADPQRSALACAVLYVHNQDRAPKEASSLCEWAHISGNNLMHCAAKIVETACQERVPEACVVLALSNDESQRKLGRKLLSNHGAEEPAASYYEAALDEKKEGLLNACYMGEAVACASLPDNSDGCPLGDCSATTDIKMLDKYCKESTQPGNRAACAQLLFSRLSTNAPKAAVEDAEKRSTSLDPAAAARGAASMHDASAGRYVMSCYLGVAQGCLMAASKVSDEKARSELKEMASLMGWRLSGKSKPLPDL
jgi:serine/threonine protein kinase